MCVNAYRLVLIGTLFCVATLLPSAHAGPLDEYKATCEEIGFTPKTEKFADCVLELHARAKNDTSVQQEEYSREQAERQRQQEQQAREQAVRQRQIAQQQRQAQQQAQMEAQQRAVLQEQQRLMEAQRRALADELSASKRQALQSFFKAL